MDETDYKERLQRIEDKLDKIGDHVTNLRVEQRGLQIKSSLWGTMGGALSCIPVLIAILFKR